MVYLHMKAAEFGLEKVATVRAAYATQEDAEAQAAHDIAINAKVPVRIEDEQGNVLKSYEG